MEKLKNSSPREQGTFGQFALSKCAVVGYVPGMALARILVDGYSLLHAWPELAEGRPRHSAAARAALVAMLTQYQDAIGTPVTVVFDGSGAPPGTPRHHEPHAVEVLFSRNGRSADDLIERAAHRLLDYGEVLVVTNDHAVRDTVSGFGAMVSSCEVFIQQLADARDALQAEIQRHNRRQRARFVHRAAL